VAEYRKIAVWYAFDSESCSREDYQRICGFRDQKNFKIILKLCEQIIRQENKESEINARAIANAISGLIEEMLKELLFAGENYARDQAKQVCLSFLASIFPWCYKMPSKSDNNVTTVAGEIDIIEAGHEDIEQLSTLFDQYRQFYQQPRNPELAKNYIAKRIKTETSVIFIARDSSKKALGFVQLYPSFCSVDTTPIWILYDLYVDSDVRKNGVAKALMNRAQKLAKETSASRIDLETAIDNIHAQALYESLGYERDTEYFKYSLEL